LVIVTQRRRKPDQAEQQQQQHKKLPKILKKFEKYSKKRSNVYNQKSMDSVVSQATLYTSAVAQLMSSGMDKLLTQTGLASTALTSTSRNATRTASEMTAAESSAFLRKAIGISVTGAAIMGSAFYVGYQLAKKRHRFHVSATDKTEQIEQILNKFKLSKESLNRVMSLMLEEMRKGLDPATHDAADIKMFPTFRIVPALIREDLVEILTRYQP
jgi:hypothetical protein